jgi:hypothetical protein
MTKRLKRRCRTGRENSQKTYLLQFSDLFTDSPTYDCVLCPVLAVYPINRNVMLVVYEQAELDFNTGYITSCHQYQRMKWDDYYWMWIVMGELVAIFKYSSRHSYERTEEKGMDHFKALMTLLRDSDSIDRSVWRPGYRSVRCILDGRATTYFSCLDTYLAPRVRTENRQLKENHKMMYKLRRITGDLDIFHRPGFSGVETRRFWDWISFFLQMKGGEDSYSLRNPCQIYTAV